MKKMVMTVAMTMVAVLVCVGFGFYLGTKQQAIYSLSKYFDSSEYLKPQESYRANPEDLPGYNPGLGTNGGMAVRSTSGEIINGTDEYGWLLTPAQLLVFGNTAVKADLSTNTEWRTATSYSATLNLPDEVFVDDSECNANVYYPTKLKAGETGNIIVLVASNNGYTYCGFCQFTATADLQIVYGSSHPQTASGGEFDVNDSQQLSINFYTGATPEYYSNRDGSASQYGADGEIHVEFIDIDTATSLKVPSLNENAA